MSIRAFIFLTLSVLAAGAGLARAETPSIPVFWDEKEQVATPDLSKRERIRFLTTTDFPPFNFLAGGRLSGFHIDLARAICNELKIAERCQIQALPWSELEAALAEGQGEAIIAGTAITADSRAKFSFTRSYLRFPARFLVPAAAAAVEPGEAAWSGRRFGVIAGSAHEAMMRDYFPYLQPVPFPAAEPMLQELKAGRLDGVFGDGMHLSFWMSSAEAQNCCKFAGGPYLAPEYLGRGLAIAVGPDDAELARAFDFALRELGVKGVFAELYLRYFPIGFF